MVENAIKMLQMEAEQATKRLTKIRTEITDSFSKDYVITSSTLEALLKAQKATRYWAQVKNILSTQITGDAQVEGLREWASSTTEALLDGGRSRSTSLITSGEHEADEDERKAVLQRVKHLLAYVDER